MAMSVFHYWYFHSSLFWLLIQEYSAGGHCSSSGVVPHIPNICLALRTMVLLLPEFVTPNSHWLSFFQQSRYPICSHKLFLSKSTLAWHRWVGFCNLNRKLIFPYNILLIFTQHSRWLEKIPIMLAIPQTSWSFAVCLTFLLCNALTRLIKSWTRDLKEQSSSSFRKSSTTLFWYGCWVVSIWLTSPHFTLYMHG